MIAKKKLYFHKEKEIKAISMAYTILTEEEHDFTKKVPVKNIESEGFIALGTSEFAFIVIKITKSGEV